VASKNIQNFPSNFVSHRTDMLIAQKFENIKYARSWDRNC